MNTNIKVRLTKDPDLFEVRDYEGGPAEYYTRVWMAVVPPVADEPGYVGVLGELYDNDKRQKARPKVLLDEGQALDPKDFDAGVVDAYRDSFFVDLEDKEGSVISVAKRDNPTLDDLRMACIALKDLYLLGADDGALCLAPPNNNPFLGYMRGTEGLTLYSPDVGEHQYKEWFPTFTSTGWTLSITDEIPMGDDEEYGKQLIESLLARDELRINEHCNLFQNSRLKHPVRAVGLMCAAMQVWDYSFRIREIQETDGYESLGEAEDREDQMREEVSEEMATIFWQAGVNVPDVA